MGGSNGSGKMKTAYRKYEFVCSDTECDSLIEVTTKVEMKDYECVCGSTMTLVGSKTSLINEGNVNPRCAWVPCSRLISRSTSGILFDYWSGKIKGSFCSDECVKKAEVYTDDLASV